MLNIPHVSRTIFKRHFIDRAILELRFPSHDFVWKKVEPEFKAAFSLVGLSVVKKSVYSQFELKTLTKQKKSNLNISSKIIGISGATPDGSLTIEIRKDRLICSCQNYVGFHDFIEKLSAVFQSINNVLGNLEFNWIGIRKVNIIGIVSQNGNYRGEGVNPMIFAPLRNGVFDGEYMRLAEAKFSLSKNGLTYNIRSRAVKESDPSKVSLMIDLDVNKKIEKISAFKIISKIAEELNAGIFDVFCWITDPSLLEEMKQD